MSTSSNPQSSSRAFACMIYTGISAALIITLASIYVGFVHSDRDPQPLPQEWSERLPLRSTHWVNRVLRYDASWNGIHAGNLRIDMKGEPADKQTHKTVSYEAQTTSRLKWAFHWNARGTTWLDPTTQQPRFAYRFTTENDESKVSWTSFSRRHRRISHLSMDSDDADPDWSEIHFVHGLDLPGLFSWLCTAPLKEGETGTFEVIENGKAYAVHFQPVKRQPISIRGKTVLARRMEVITAHLTSENEENTPRNGTRPNIDLWLQDATGIPLRIFYTGILGKITVELASPIPHEDATR